MSIGIVTESDWTIGGIGVFGTEVCPRLLARDETTPIEIDHTGIRSLPFPSVLTYGKRYLVGNHIKKQIMDSGTDVVFLPDHRYLTFDPRTVPQTVIPYVHDVLPVTTLFSDIPSTLFARFYTHQLSKLEFAICASAFTASDLRFRTPFDGETEVIYQGVDRVSTSNDSKFDYDLLYVGSTIERKNPQFLSECFSTAERAGYRCAAVTSHDTHLPGDVFSDVSDETLSQLLAGARFYLHPSKQEGFGRPPVEAQKLGTPVIGLRTQINEEILGEPSRDWVPISDPSELTGVLERDESEYDTLRSQSRQNAARFSWETAADEIYETLLGC